MNVVSTELDGLILAVAIAAVLLLAGVLIVIRNILSTNRKILQNQQNQSQLLMAISNVLSSGPSVAETPARQETGVNEKQDKQIAE